MTFNSLGYFLFLPIVFLIHYYCRDSFRWLVLLVASFIFYAALQAPHLILVLLLVTTVTYYAAIRIGRSEHLQIKRRFLWGGITVNLLMLISLKYLSFFTQHGNTLISYISPDASIPVNKTLIAIGTSYFIIQAISYLVDIYLDVAKPELHFGYFALYMSFFPKLLQGPIERGGDLLPQLKQPYLFDYNSVRTGMLLFAWGLFQKVVIAERLALMVNTVYDNVSAYQGFTFVLATYYFALQIYFDFAGYTAMALGTAKMFNINLTQNFNAPYLAVSIADFWRRWHISFSHWILDYIFKPLQMELRNWREWGSAAAILVTFTLSGLWHGSNWTYLVWGLLHGGYMVVSLLSAPLRKRFHPASNPTLKSGWRWFQRIITFHLVCFAWIFFRANSLSDAGLVIARISPITLIKNALNAPIKEIGAAFFIGHDILDIAIIATSLITVAMVHLLKGRFNLMESPLLVRWGVYITLAISTACFSCGLGTGFMYTKF
jgi:D-alanyl-lipoteichoic acid acyltransferase DltB (MBOAT superfamily)